MENEGPRNQKGQAPSQGSQETTDRLTEKEQGLGQANRARVEAQKDKIDRPAE